MGEGIYAKRNALAGSADQGDITVDIDLVTIEVKNEKRMALSEYVNEAEVECKNAGTRYGVAWHKRRGKGSPGDWYVTMTGETFKKILESLIEHK